MKEKNFLNYFFQPKSIALVGASNNPAKAGFQILKNLTKNKFSCLIYPVNPRENEINGIPCYPSLKRIDSEIDLVIITTPANQAKSILIEAAERGDVKAVIVISAGFSETKTPEGIRMEREIVEIARKAGIRIIGPNCSGVMNASIKLDTTIQPIVKQIGGKIGIFSQSGAITGTVILFAESQPKPIGFSKMVHVGNMCDVNTLDVLSYYGEDRNTEVIVLYMEGFNKGRAFIDIAKEITSKKPVIVLKVGRNDLGAEAAYSHTGALAGKDEIYEAAFRKSGITRVDGLRELIDSAKAFLMQPLPSGNKICILTEAGGPGTMAMDELGKYKQVRLASISKKGQQQLKEVLPSIAVICQPDGYVDMTAAAMEKHHREALETIIDEKEVDGIILITVPPTFLPPESLAKELVKTIKSSKKPILACLLAGRWVHKARQILEREGIPTFDTPEQAVKAMVNMVNRKNYLNNILQGD